MNERKRRADVLEAVDIMIATHDAWEADENGPDVPTEAFELALDDMIAACASGDVPGEMRELIGAVGRLGVEWESYKQGNRDRSHRPTAAFWNAFRAVLGGRAHSQKITPRRPPPVKELIDQGVTLQQIAFAIYGSKREGGPFVGEEGDILYDEVYKEAAEPGSVISKDWCHPSEIERVREHNEGIENRIQAVAEREKEDIPDTPAYSIEELLTAGVFPEQIAKIMRCEVKEVLEAAQSAGIQVTNLPNLSSMRSPYEPQLSPEDDAALQPRPKPLSDEEYEQAIANFGPDETEPDDGGSTKIDPKMDLSDEEFLQLQIVKLSEDGLSSMEIRDELGCTVQKAAQVLRRHREKVAEQGAAG